MQCELAGVALEGAQVVYLVSFLVRRDPVELSHQIFLKGTVLLKDTLVLNLTNFVFQLFGLWDPFLGHFYKLFLRRSHRVVLLSLVIFCCCLQLFLLKLL